MDTVGLSEVLTANCNIICQLCLEFSIEIAEMMENSSPLKNCDLCIEHWPVVLQLEVRKELIGDEEQEEERRKVRLESQK